MRCDKSVSVLMAFSICCPLVLKVDNVNSAGSRD
jgi:hypothetical protein